MSGGFPGKVLGGIVPGVTSVRARGGVNGERRPGDGIGGSQPSRGPGSRRRSRRRADNWHEDLPQTSRRVTRGRAAGSGRRALRRKAAVRRAGQPSPRHGTCRGRRAGTLPETGAGPWHAREVLRAGEAGLASTGGRGDPPRGFLAPRAEGLSLAAPKIQQVFAAAVHAPAHGLPFPLREKTRLHDRFLKKTRGER